MGFFTKKEKKEETAKSNLLLAMPMFNNGERFDIELSTSFNDLEVIDHMYFYNYLDSMSEEQKKALGRRTDENGREICGDYMDIKTMKIIPSYCTPEELEEE